MKFTEQERLIDLIRKSRTEAIIKLKSPEKAESSLTWRPLVFKLCPPDWMTPAINQHWFQIALLGVSTVFYPLLADVLLLASLLQRAVKLLWNEQLQRLSCWICCGKQNWTTTNKLFHADSFQRKNLFWRCCWVCGICHLVTTLTLGKNAKSTSSQQGAF